MLCRSRVLVIFVLIWGLTAPAAFGGTIEEIVVMAEKRERGIGDVPIAMNAFDEEITRERELIGVADIARQIPGVFFSEFSGSGNLFIRGVGTTIVSGAGEGSVATHLDGVYLPQPKALPMAQEGLEFIEVLKGPQGTLYGRNATGGVINLYSKAPERDFGAGVTFGGGSHQQRRASGYVTGPLGERAEARIELRYRDSAGYAKNLTTGQKLEGIEGWSGKLALDVSVTETWSMEVRVTSSKEDWAGPLYDSFDASFPVFPEPLSAYDAREVVSIVEYDSSRELTSVSLRNTFSLTPSTDLVSVTGFAGFDETGVFDGIGSVVSVPLDRKSSSKAWSQEFNVIGSTERVDWLLGAYFLEEDLDESSFTDFSLFASLPLGSVGNLLDQSSTKTSYSLFADAGIPLTDRSRLYGGVRWLRTEVDQDLTVVNTGITLCDRNDPRQKDKDYALTGRLGVQFDVADSSMVYLQYARGYKAGGFSQSNCDNPFEPEELDAFEVGFKSKLANDRVALNASLFYYDYANLQLEQATPAGIPVVNAPKSRIHGGEIDVRALLADRLSVDASLSVLRSEYRRFINSDPLLGTPPGADLSGNALNYAPEYSLLIGASYDLLVSSAGILSVRGELYATDEYQLREFDSPFTRQEAYRMGNVYVNFRSASERYVVRGYVKNLGDETVLGGVLGFGGALGSFHPPRTYGLSVEIHL